MLGTEIESEFKIPLKFSVAPFPLKYLFRERTRAFCSSLLNKSVDCVLLGVGGAWWFIISLGYTVHLCKPYILAGILRSIKELEYSLTLRTLYINAANIVAINCYEFAWLLPALIRGYDKRLCCYGLLLGLYVTSLLPTGLQPTAKRRSMINGCIVLILIFLRIGISIGMEHSTNPAMH